MNETTTERKAKRTKAVARPSLVADRIFSRSEAALATGVAEITLIRALEAGHLHAYRAGRRILHSGQHLLDWLEAGGKTSKGGR